MRVLGNLVISEEVFKRERCHSWHCGDKATHYTFFRSTSFLSRKRKKLDHAIGAYCKPHSRSFRTEFSYNRTKAYFDRNCE